MHYYIGIDLGTSAMKLLLMEISKRFILTLIKNLKTGVSGFKEAL